MADKVQNPRRRGRTRISNQHQITIPVDAMAVAGLQPGDRLRVQAAGPGRITLVRDDDILERYAGTLTGLWPPGELDALRDEWDRRS